MFAFLRAVLVCLPLVVSSLAGAVIDFENVDNGTPVTNQYSGLVFSGAVVLSAGLDLNEFEYPPHSGSNVLADIGGTISIDFLTAASGFSGYFTYRVPLTMTIFDQGGT